MFWNIFVRPKFHFTEQADVCVTAFEADDEAFVRELFYKRHIGLDIITTSHHPTRELAYKQIDMLGSVVRSHFEFFEPSMMCSQCGLNPVGSMSSSEQLCDFCYIEGEYEKGSDNPLNGK